MERALLPRPTALRRFLRLAFSLLLLAAAAPAAAQTVVDVEPGFGSLNEAVEEAAANTTFRLQRGATYFLSSDIDNQVPIAIVAAEGDGARPIVQPAVGGGGTSDRAFRPGASLTLRGLFITNEVDGGGVEKNTIRLDASAERGTRLVIEDCILTKDTQSLVRIGATGATVIIRNSVLKDVGSLDDPNNGRAIDPRGNDVDSLVIDGNTFYNLSSTILRDDGGRINYLQVTNNTAHYVGQYIIDMGSAAEVLFQDNLFIDSGYEGTEDGEDEPTPLIRLDSLEADPEFPIAPEDAEYTISNVNFYLAPSEILSGRQPPVLFDETALNTLAAQGVDDLEADDDTGCITSESAVILCEDIAFADAPGEPFDFAGEPFDFSYAETFDSFTAGTDGLPLGDRRYFDDLGGGGGGGEEDTRVATAAELLDAVANAEEGDVIILTSTEPYALDAAVENTVALTIRADEGLSQRPTVTAAQEVGDPLVRPKASITLEGLTLDAAGLFEEILRVKDEEAEGIDVVVRNSELMNSRTDEDGVRIDVAIDDLIFEDVLIHDTGRRPVATREEASVDSLVLRRSSVYNAPDRMRFQGTHGLLLFEQVTVTDLDGDAIDVQGATDALTIRNSLLVNGGDDRRAIDVGDAAEDDVLGDFTIEYTNVFPLEDEFGETLDDVSEVTFNEGTGNFSADPQFQDPEDDDFSLAAGTEAATGAEDGGPVGDPSWGVYRTTAGEVSVATAAELLQAVEDAVSGDIITLTGAEYALSEAIRNEVPLTIRAAEGLDAQPVLTAAGEVGDPLVRPEASITIEGAVLDGAGQFEEVLRVKDEVPEGTRIVVRDGELTGSRSGEDLVRIDVPIEDLILENVLIHDAGRRPLATREEASVDSLVVQRATVYDAPEDRIRLQGTHGVVLFERVTITGLKGDAIDLQGPADEFVLRNGLIVSSTEEGERALDLEDAEEAGTLGAVSITYTNIFPNEGEDDIDGEQARTAFAEGEGNFSEDPQFEAPADGDFSLLEGTPSATGGSDGGPVGDPQWGTYVPFEAPASVSVSVSESFGDATEAENFELVALPGQVSRDVGATLSGTAGEDWNAYWDNGADSEDAGLEAYDGSSAFEFEPGRGFWLISREAWDVSETLDAVELDEGFDYAIPVHDGWNIISNPFDVDVAWSAVQAANGDGLTQPIWDWDGSFSESQTFASASSGEAYYFFNGAGLTELVLPYPGAPGNAGEEDLRTAEAALTLTAYADGRRASAIRVGFAEDATAGHDAYDRFAPPGRFEAASLRLDSPDANGPALAADFRMAGRDGYAFSLTLGAEAGERVELRAADLDRLGGREAWLVESATAQAYDLRGRPAVALRAEGDTPVRLTLLVGSRAFVERETGAAVPERFELAPSYPNPFRRRATIAYALPEAAEVRLEVYDVLGRRVATLVDERQPAGRHEARLDGGTLPSGVYFYRIAAGEHIGTGRMVLVK